jgi:FkbM family methyltransferase
MTALLQPGDVFIDVGANIGYHSLLAARLVGARGRVFSIEPAPQIRASFEHNLALNPELSALCNITMLPYCASDQTGTVLLSAPDSGNSGETTMRTLGPDAIVTEVESRTLDAMLEGADLSRCPLLKMDVEGAEYLAVTGMESTLDRHPHISLMLEVDDRFMRDLGHSADQLFRWFLKKNYEIYTIVAPRSNLLGEPVVLQRRQDAPRSPENVLFTRLPNRFSDWISH